MPMSRTEAARRGGQARHRGLTPDQRQEATKKARLALAVKELVDQAPELSTNSPASGRSWEVAPMGRPPDKRSGLPGQKAAPEEPVAAHLEGPVEAPRKPQLPALVGKDVRTKDRWKFERSPPTSCGYPGTMAFTRSACDPVNSGIRTRRPRRRRRRRSGPRRRPDTAGPAGRPTLDRDRWARSGRRSRAGSWASSTGLLGAPGRPVAAARRPSSSA